MEITITAISKIQNARFYISKNEKQFETFLYTKSQTLCKKKDNSHYIFICKNIDILHYAIFHEIFEVGTYCMNEKSNHKVAYTVIRLVR